MVTPVTHHGPWSGVGGVVRVQGIEGSLDLDFPF